MIVITGGGTGGHLAIARALAQELQRREIPAVYIGSLYGQDQQWFAGESGENWAFENRVGFWAKNGDCGGESALITTQGKSLASPCKAPFLAPKSCREQTSLESTKVDSSSTPKSIKSPTSTTAIPRILKKNKGAECEKSCREQTALESTFSQSHDIKANAAIPSLRADALSEAIHKESTKVDSSSAPQNPLFQQCYFLNTSGVVNKKGFKKLASIYAQLRAALRVRKIFAKHKVRAVISVGGFSAGPASLAAILLRKPLFIHEQNAIQGRLNSLLAPFAKAVFNSFHPPFPPYPIKQEALQRRRIRTEFQSIIFIGGSQGAKAINDLALQAAPKLLARGIRIIHQCGEKDLERVRQAYQKVDSSLVDSSDSKPLESSFDTSSSQPPKLTLFGFDKDLIKHLDKADICVARAGASSIWENAALSLPTIYIPYPYAANNHQLHNASYFTNQGLGLMITEQDLSTKPAQAAQKGAEQKVDSSEHSTDIRAMDLAKFFALLSQLESNLEAISTNLSQTITENGAQSIITQILAALEPATPAPPK